MIVLNAVIIPNFKYNDAMALIESGNIVDAYDILISLDGYKDSEEISQSIYVKLEIEKIKSAKVGDYVFFGSYEQDNNIANGKEEIEWIVLDIKDGKIFVISRYALDAKQYNTSCEEITWESCNLRNWLDNDFINDAFSDEEKQNVFTVFLLSVTEVNKYFNTDSVRQCMPTAYAEANGVSSSGVWDDKNCKWWLRTLGNNEDSAALVSYTGAIDEKGSYVNVNDVAVRPAVWIDLNE